MPGGRGFLDRLRPVGTPGAAARRGVPADRLAEIGVELEPLFALLAEVDAEADRIRGDARAQVTRTVQDGEVQAAAVVAAANERAESVRAAAAARGRARAAVAEEELARAAEDQLILLRERAAAGMAALVGRAVAAARSELSELAGFGASTP